MAPISCDGRECCQIHIFFHLLKSCTTFDFIDGSSIMYQMQPKIVYVKDFSVKYCRPHLVPDTTCFKKTKVVPGANYNNFKTTLYMSFWK